MEYKTLKLSELLNKEEIKEITKFINKNDWVNLRIFLNSDTVKNKLYNKGVIADYLYYYLQYALKK